MKTIAIANQKGGVGKTTSAIQIGAGLTQLGKRVLLIDLDPQANLTHSLGIMAHESNKTIYQVLKGEVAFEEVWVDRAGMKILPSTIYLSGAETELSGMLGRDCLLREGIGRPWGFDYILIDCPPSLGLLTLNAFTTAKEIYIPLRMGVSALQGLQELLQTVKMVKKWFNKVLTVTGVIRTRFDPRNTYDREMKEKIRAHFWDAVFRTPIREDISLAEASSLGKTIFEYKPDSQGAEAYSALCDEIVEGGYKGTNEQTTQLSSLRVR